MAINTAVLNARVFNQGTLIEGEASVQLTSLY
jgi:hypothetical protein